METDGEISADDGSLEDLLRVFAGNAQDTPSEVDEGLQRARLAAREIVRHSTPGQSLPEGMHKSQWIPGPGGLIGHYRLLRRIGAGGMGIVYLAEHELLRKAFAVKVLTDRRLGDPASIARFEREMRLMGQFDHPNLGSATDGGCVDGVHYMAMNFINGVDVGTLVRALGPLSVAVSCEVIRQAAVGLQQLHERLLIHRDIKPSNLIVGFDRVVRVTDFGLARVIHPNFDDELSNSGQVLGTVAYMPPEQFDGTELSCAADLYSLGATLWFMLSGHPPSPWRADLKSSSNPRHVLPPTIPGDLCQTISHLLDGDPEKRIQTAEEVISRMSAYARPECWDDLLAKLREVDLYSESYNQTLLMETVNASSVPGSNAGQSLGTASLRGYWPVWLAAGALGIFALGGAIGYLKTASSPPTRITVAQPSSTAIVPKLLADADDVDAYTDDMQLKPEVAATERAAAIWIVSRGGNVLLHPTSRAYSLEEIPDYRFYILNIVLPHAKVGPEDMHRLARLVSVRQLDLRGNPIDDSNLIVLSTYRSIRWLYLGQTNISDVGMEHLLPLGRSLETLDLQQTQVTSAGISQLNSFNNLRELYVNYTAIDDDALIGLERFPSLLRLSIEGTSVSSVGIEHLHSHPRLKFLLADATKIGDESIGALSKLQSLRELSIRKTKFTPDGYQQLVSALPDCRISF